jgi:hypothetical protein
VPAPAGLSGPGSGDRGQVTGNRGGGARPPGGQAVRTYCGDRCSTDREIFALVGRRRSEVSDQRSEIGGQWSLIGELGLGLVGLPAGEEGGEFFSGFGWPERVMGDEGGVERSVFGPGWLLGDEGEDGGEDFLGGGGVGEQVADDVLGGDGILIGFPAIVIGDHGEGGEGDFRFAGEFGFGEVGHAHDVETQGAVDHGLGAGGERRAVHVDVGAAVVDAAALGEAGGVEQRSQTGGDGIGETDVSDDALAEKSMVIAPAGSVKELIGQDDVTRGVRFLE